MSSQQQANKLHYRKSLVYNAYEVYPHKKSFSIDSSSLQVPVTPENPAKRTGAREEDHPMSSVLGEISNMLSTVIKRLEKTESRLESMECRLIL